jgi:multiple sugar transport system substrate-binding protein
VTLRGLSWGHRRATGPTDAIARAARERLSIEVEWEVQSLAGFEHGLGDALADRYDLIVFDHPFCGSVAACRLMHPLDTVLADLRDEDFVGRSLDSYRYAGHLWALPVDGATQCAVYRPDLIQGDGLPTDWDAVVRLGERLRREGRWLGLATLAPHSAPTSTGRSPPTRWPRPSTGPCCAMRRASCARSRTCPARTGAR